MEKTKWKRLQAAGWVEGSADDLVGLRPEESAMLDARMAAGSLVRALRAKAGLTQAQVAARLGTGQARVAKIENGAGDCTLDRMLAAAFALGATSAEYARAVLAEAKRRRPAEAPARKAVAKRAAARTQRRARGGR